MKKIEDKPAQYTKGYCEFYKLKFYLTRDVLIPRPETELLVDEVLKIARITSNQLTVLDIGTGSGCIAISIAENALNAKIIAIDISERALKVAEKNAKLHKVEDRMIFLHHDLLPDFKVAPDIIVANLPYIPTARLAYIDPMVTNWEPKIALDGGKDGFELYRRLLAQMKEKKIIPKYFIGEIDYTHGEIAVFEVLKNFPDAKAEVRLDLSHKQRILVVEF